MPPTCSQSFNFTNFAQVFELMPMGALWNSTKIAKPWEPSSRVPSPRTPSPRFAALRSPLHPLPLDHHDPGQVTLILYILFSRIGWIDTHSPLIVPAVLLNAYGVFLIKQFMEAF